MPSDVRLLDLGLTEPWRTQAVYHAVAETMTVDTPDTLVLCRPASPYVCLGYHQVFDSVLDRQACEARDIPVYRRRVGGGLTYLDSNQLFYQCIFHESRVPANSKDVYARMLAAPVAALQRLGLDAALHFENEVEVSERRVAGIGGARIDEAMVVVGNLLFHFDHDALASLWRVPSEAFRNRARGALEKRLTTLNALLGSISVADVREILLEEFARAFAVPIHDGVLSAEEEERARHVHARMSSAEYLNLHRNGEPVAPMTSLKISARESIKEAL